MEVTDVQYKESEIGVLPLDWEVKTLGDVGEVKMCRRVFNQETKSEGVIPFYKIGTFGKEADAYISQELYDNYRQRFSFPKTGDVLISAAGTIGRTMVYDGEPAYYQDSNIVWIDNKEGLVLNKYLYYVLQVAKYNTEGGTIQRLYNSILKNTKFICPAKSEQTAIATALSDTDALIENLEKLIAKKRNIKQGVMQELLTGRKRLAGFNGEWMKIKLGDICDIRKGQLITEKTAAGGEFPVIAGGINPSYFHNRPNRGKNTITISASGANAGYVSFHRNPIFASDCSTIEEKGTFNIVYIFFLLQLFQKKIFKLQTGGAQPHVYPEHLKPLELVFPQEVTEQDAIANILIDIDEELSGLEKQMNKYQLIKQGMMQTLLTGKIRLV
jgi:type I restriction enzyme S subunit